MTPKMFVNKTLTGVSNEFMEKSLSMENKRRAIS
jgi:hypothetical protein